jgi:hypothetical protein
LQFQTARIGWQRSGHSFEGRGANTQNRQPQKKRRRKIHLGRLEFNQYGTCEQFDVLSGRHNLTSLFDAEPRGWVKSNKSREGLCIAGTSYRSLALLPILHISAPRGTGRARARVVRSTQKFRRFRVSLFFSLGSRKTNVAKTNVWKKKGNEIRTQD